MDIFDTIAARHSVRTYKPDPVPDELIGRCLEAARVAPSWRNGQCWRFVVVREPATIEKLAAQRVYGYRINAWLRTAPVVIVACAEPGESGQHTDLPYWAVDTAIALEHLVLAATALGLGTCWIGGFDEKTVRALLAAPERIRVVAYTPLGYPAEGEALMGRAVKAIARSHSRKPLEKIVFHERWLEK
ncbi:MAG: nitroreductase family protein [Chloroflexi bacterium]|nr:nitroreductase family protein [Chloroflexota bacterium]